MAVETASEVELEQSHLHRARRGARQPDDLVHRRWRRAEQLLNRAEQALAAGDSAQGILYLASAYEFDPRNYRAGITLAKHLHELRRLRPEKLVRRRREKFLKMGRFVG